jgi:hypothetical protein
MYLGNISGYGTSDFNKALKGTNIAAIEKGLAFQEKQLAKRKPKDTKGIAADQGQIAAAKARLAQLQADPGSKAVLTKVPIPVAAAPTVPAITTPPPPVSAPSPTVSPVPQVSAPAPSVAPPNAAESFVNAVAQAPSMFGPAQNALMPTFSPAPTSTPDTAPAAAPTESSNMPLILGAVGVGALLLFMSKRKK